MEQHLEIPKHLKELGIQPGLHVDGLGSLSETDIKSLDESWEKLSEEMAKEPGLHKQSAEVLKNRFYTGQAVIAFREVKTDKGPVGKQFEIVGFQGICIKYDESVRDKLSQTMEVAPSILPDGEIREIGGAFTTKEMRGKKLGGYLKKLADQKIERGSSTTTFAEILAWNMSPIITNIKAGKELVDPEVYPFSLTFMSCLPFPQGLGNRESSLPMRERVQGANLQLFQSLVIPSSTDTNEATTIKLQNTEISNYWNKIAFSEVSNEAKAEVFKGLPQYAQNIIRFIYSLGVLTLIEDSTKLKEMEYSLRNASAKMAEQHDVDSIITELQEEYPEIYSSIGQRFNNILNEKERRDFLCMLKGIIDYRLKY